MTLCVACGGSPDSTMMMTPPSIDGPTSVVPDAAPVIPDAPHVTPDAAALVADAAHVPDARPGTPDARPVPDSPPGTPDAKPVPDSPPGTPDAKPVPDSPPGTPDAKPVPDSPPGTPDAPMIDAPPGTPDAPPPPDANILPGAPTGVTAVASITQAFVVSWTAPASSGASPIVGYKIYASCSNSIHYYSIYASLQTTQIFELAAPPATTCTVTVSASNASGEGPQSEPTASVMVVSGPTRPDAQACGGTHHIYITAPDVAGAVSYQIYRSTSTGLTQLTGTLVGTHLPFSDSDVTDGTTYYYVVTATNAAGIKSRDSAEVNAKATSAFNNVLFAVGNANISISDCQSSVADGETRWTRAITGLSGDAPWDSIYVDATNRRIYITRLNPPKVLVWDNADTVDGNVAASRHIDLTNDTSGIFVDTGASRLYVAIPGAPAIRVFSIAGDGTFSQAAYLTGDNTLLSSNMKQIFVHGSADTLWVANDTNVLVFGNASTLSGTVHNMPDRVLGPFPSRTGLNGIWLDSGRAYVGDTDAGAVYAVDGAPTAHGDQNPPSAVLQGDAFTGTVQVQVRSGALYTSSQDNDLVHVFANVSQYDCVVGGCFVDHHFDVSPARTIGTGLANLHGFFVVP
jgi:hypothetical protein